MIISSVHSSTKRCPKCGRKVSFHFEYKHGLIKMGSKCSWCYDDNDLGELILCDIAEKAYFYRVADSIGLCKHMAVKELDNETKEDVGMVG